MLSLLWWSIHLTVIILDEVENEVNVIILRLKPHPPRSITKLETLEYLNIDLDTQCSNFIDELVYSHVLRNLEYHDASFIDHRTMHNATSSQ